MNNYKVVKVEDTKESFANAVSELHNSLMKGSGVGFDLRGISKQSIEKIETDFNKITNEIIIAPRSIRY